MNCEFFKNNILDFYYNDCNNDTSLKMREHIARCHECAALYGKMAAVLGSADRVKEAVPDAFYYTRLSSKMDRVHQMPVYTRWLMQAAKPLLAASFVIFGVFVGYEIYDKLQQIKPVNANNISADIAEVQLADEYMLKADSEEILNTYFFNE